VGKRVAAKRKPVKKKAKPAPKAKAKAKTKTKAKPKQAAISKWVKLVEKHGIMLAAAHGPVLNIAQSVAGEPIVGGWWAHPKGKAIFAALSEIDDSVDVRCFKLIDGKVTFVHRRMWPALVRLGNAGAVATEMLGCVQQEHMPTGEHRNTVVPFPEWVDDATAVAAGKLDVDAARALVPYL
jgi:hypothetical protein